MSFLRPEADINMSVRKATSIEETAPKRKHVRACVVYTWDHRSGREFWNAVRLVPVQNDDIMCFKSLITVHKVLHEGHPSVLKEAQHHVNWLQSLSRGGMWAKGGYGRLIDEYVRLLLHKLDFHRTHPAFNGTFEYKEYLSLRSVDDPNEGYESIIDLMNLQDSIDDFQRLVFASVSARGRAQFGGSTECRVSSLTAMVTESYGIYRFVTSMLRALHAGSDAEVLEPLRNRYYSQHRRLRNFYFDCGALKYLVSLITIPELPADPPDLFQSEGEAPALPKRPREHRTGESLAPTPTGASSVPQSIVAQPTGDWWQNGGAAAIQQQQEEEERQRQLMEYQQQLAAQQAAVQAEQQAAQEAFIQQQQQQHMAQQQQQAAHEAFLQQQAQQHTQGRAAELEHELFLLRNQQEEAQNMLQQYDARVQALESDLDQVNSLTQQQLDAKTEQLASVQTQIDTWKSKYEALAKLYSQLRHEHLDLLAKHRKVQAKAASAQEAVDKREKLERDLKAKNLELADLIRERDRARYELDRARGQHEAESERLERNISLLNDKLAEGDRSRGTDLSALSASHARQLNLLEEQLAQKEKLVNELGGSDALREKDDEIEVLRETIGELESAFKDVSLNGGGKGSSEKLVRVLDAILLAAAEQVQQALTQFDSPIEGGNAQATPPYVLSLSEKSSSTAEAFSDAFTTFVAENEGESEGGQGGDPVAIITAATLLSGSMADLLTNVKGLSGLMTSDDVADSLTFPAREAAASVCAFYTSLHSDYLGDLSTDDKLELIIASHVDIQQHLQGLAEAAEKLLPKTSVLTSKSLDKQVDDAMTHLADTVADANSKLTTLLSRPMSSYKAFNREISEAIISAAVALTSAIAALIRAAAECQREIVAKGRQGESADAYYKKNHRWTEGLISAARLVASSTDVLIETADGTIDGKRTPEELIVASREVASSTAQLVAASRSKADYLSKSQEGLESASKSVTSATRSLVARVEKILADRQPAEDERNRVDYTKLNPLEFKTAAMEQQVEVLKIEQQLTQARNRLFEIRKLEYAQQGDEEEEV